MRRASQRAALAAARLLFQRAPQRYSGCRRPFSDVSATVTVTFMDPFDGPVALKGNAGLSLLEVAHLHNIELEGACGGELACSTCHVIFSPSDYARTLKQCPKGEEEDDMLDLAWGLTETSRLGCQIKLSPELEVIVCQIPEESSNMQ